MKKVEGFLKKINIDYVFYALLFAFFILSLFFSTFRDAIRDETIYIHETYLIAELLKNGIWIGDYAVGLHGFLFKLPPALVFIFTGPSVFVLTLYNIILATGACYLFYRFLKEAFKWNTTALLVTGILMANFHFILTIPTYLREMPSLIVILLLFYAIFKNWKPWILGLIFLLLLDAKEYLFFMFGLGYFVWILIKYLRVYTKQSFYEKSKKIFLECLQVYGISIVFMILMFTTSLIPVNMFLASILGFLSTGAEYLTTHFAVDTATANLMEEEAKRVMFQFPVDENYPIFIQFVLNVFNTILSYIGKILYPRTFSFLSIPKVVILPAVYMAIRIFKQAWDEKKTERHNLDLIFPILMIVYLAIYLLRASHGRYLLPIAPLVSIYFIYFLYYSFHDKVVLKKVLLTTLLFMLGGFWFEVGYLPFKIGIEVFLFLCIGISVLEPFKLSREFYVIFRKLTVAFCFVFMFGISIMFALTQGQVKNYLLFGQNREINHLVEMIPEETKVWVNNEESYNLMAVYYGQTYSRPEWRWELSSLIPKKDLLETYGQKYLYNDGWFEIEDFEEYIFENEIEYVVFKESEVEESLFLLQDFLPYVKDANWLSLERVNELQNKRVYLFKVE